MYLKALIYTIDDDQKVVLYNGEEKPSKKILSSYADLIKDTCSRKELANKSVANLSVVRVGRPKLLRDRFAGRLSIVLKNSGRE